MNTIDLSLVIVQLSAEGYQITQSQLATFSPYLMAHLKRDGDYVVDWQNLPRSWEVAIPLPIDIFER